MLGSGGWRSHQQTKDERIIGNVPAGTGQATALTSDEKYWLTYMREEEKFARDVYLSLGALKVSVLIEETDISDLNKAIAATTHNDVIIVYNNLLQGSMNHLNAFSSDLARY